jgi:hypothetical protein
MEISSEICLKEQDLDCNIEEVVLIHLLQTLNLLSFVTTKSFLRAGNLVTIRSIRLAVMLLIKIKDWA